MAEWHINNQSSKQLVIQQNEQQLSIVQPLSNGSYKILADIIIDNHQVVINDTSLYVSADFKQLELNIFDTHDAT
ncbi:hypothetical protein J3T65_11640 [Staphylococcus simiae]|uniref:hypothetical protein n=1 Tax=Staphylococcus simiae TaxID=308354 RepID=UPI001A95F0E0|nr:hypothetical protein [Staphylococcus simiae]MBO1200011.1 hypothetical protein [Staphylococcus simiae]MBO1202264.1 hypothetical protein [Staphylococcus simiae]MBO1204520.1 hypothetical protein [Staphylococcus simiae]MBO1212071.1 hypothetical protein [Staphylococcus simiae]MBO1230689.1 hypothetical protein [Staphylococcus simiae]